MGIRFIIIYILLILNTNLHAQTIEYRGLNCINNPILCKSVRLDKNLGKDVFNEDDLKKIRELYLKERLFDTLYEWCNDKELLDTYYKDYKEGYIWVRLEESPRKNLKDYLNITFNEKESEYEYTSDNTLRKIKIGDITFNDISLKYGNINRGYSIFNYSNELKKIEENTVNINIPFEFIGGIYEVENNNMVYPAIYNPILELRYE